MFKRLVVVVLVVGHLVVVRAGDAAACSCMPIEPANAIADFDAAFVGSLTDRPGSSMPFTERAEYRFSVEQWVKGDLGQEIIVLAPNQGSACGFEAPLGQRVGVLLTVRDGEAHGNLCTTVDADLLLAGDGPMLLDGSGPPAYLVAGPQGRSRLLVLDTAGGLLATAPEEDGWLGSVVVCPGGDALVEMVDDQLIVRTTADLAELRRVDLEGLPFEVSIPGLWCRADDGSTIWLAIETWDPVDGPMFQLVDSSDPTAPLIEGPYRSLEVGADHAVAVEGVESPVVWRIPLDASEPTLLHEAPKAAGESTPGLNVWVDPSGTLAMIAEWRYRDDLGGRTLFVLYDLTDGSERWRSETLPTADGVGWADGEHFLATAYPDIDSDEVLSLLIDVRAGTVEELPALPGWRSLFVGATLVGVADSTLNVLSPESAAVEPLRLLPSASHHLVAVLDGATAPTPTTTTPTTSPTTSTTEPPDTPVAAPIDPGRDSPASGWFAAITLGLIVVALSLGRRSRS